ncbi:Malformin synthetase mlfA [Dirofilaria immitis]
MYTREALQQHQQQKQQRNSCFPTCKTPDKRDFMDSNPPRTTDDFYRYYDPWIGIDNIGNDTEFSNYNFHSDNITTSATHYFYYRKGINSNKKQY